VLEKETRLFKQVVPEEAVIVTEVGGAGVPTVIVNGLQVVLYPRPASVTVALYL
jgi:hypothetical protein